MNYLNNKIIEYSKNVLGFDFIEFAKPELLISEVNYLENWLKHGLHGNMTWLERNIEKRIDVKQILPCLLYTSDAADERSSVDLGGRRIIKKKIRRLME